ncbi:hypothetical protein VULLAG_LOCUS23578 [Vulpes lagopus]
MQESRGSGGHSCPAQEAEVGLLPVPRTPARKPGQMALPTPGRGLAQAPQATARRPTPSSPGYQPSTSKVQGDKPFRRGTPSGLLGRQSLGSKSHSWRVCSNSTSRDILEPHKLPPLWNLPCFQEMPGPCRTPWDLSGQALQASHLVPRLGESPAHTLHLGELQLIL